ncbi:MAG: hypothetical protein OHK0046_40140 [Anaerolineae bacterium]
MNANTELDQLTAMTSFDGSGRSSAAQDGVHYAHQQQPENQPAQQGGSLLNRIAKQTQQAPATNGNSSTNNANNANNGQQPANRLSGGSRFANNQTNQQQNNSTPPGRFGRPNPFNNSDQQNQVNWSMLPMERTLARFELRGLGDPFYRLLGHPLSTEYGDSRVVSRVLEEGGEAVAELELLLNTAWDTYNLVGATLVYNWAVKPWEGIAQPTPMPFDNDQQYQDDDDNQKKTETPQTPPFRVVRAIDLQLVLNVLARARTQLLLATAPLVFSQQYLNRALVTDDPRLVALVLATGCLED